jgi:hypothetical protein
LVQHRDYAGIANCRPNIPKTFQEIFGILGGISEFDLCISRFHNEPLTTPRGPQWEALRQVEQSAQCCRGAACQGMMDEETGRSVHVDRRENEMGHNVTNGLDTTLLNTRRLQIVIRQKVILT